MAHRHAAPRRGSPRRGHRPVRGRVWKRLRQKQNSGICRPRRGPPAHGLPHRHRRNDHGDSVPVLHLADGRCRGGVPDHPRTAGGLYPAGPGGGRLLRRHDLHRPLPAGAHGRPPLPPLRSGDAAGAAPRSRRLSASGGAAGGGAVRRQGHPLPHRPTGGRQAGGAAGDHRRVRRRNV